MSGRGRLSIAWRARLCALVVVLVVVTACARPTDALRAAIAQATFGTSAPERIAIVRD